MRHANPILVDAAVMDQGLGIALKIDERASRAPEVAVGGILRAVGAIDDSQFAALRATLEPDVLNVAGLKVGMVRASTTLWHEQAAPPH